MSKVIYITEETKQRLDAIKEPGESYNSVLRRIFNLPLSRRQTSRLRNLREKNKKRLEELTK